MANHLEAVNHCPTTRTQLREKLAENGLLEKTFIPNDGEVIEHRTVTSEEFLDIKKKLIY